MSNEEAWDLWKKVYVAYIAAVANTVPKAVSFDFVIEDAVEMADRAVARASQEAEK